MTSVIVSPGVIVEHVGGELLVVVPGNTDVVKLTDSAAEILLDIQAGKVIDLTHPSVSELVALGIVSAPGFSRRGLIKAGAIGAGAGVAVLAMPSVAAASSVDGDGDDGDEDEGAVDLRGEYFEPEGDGIFRIAFYDFVLFAEDNPSYPFPGGFADNEGPELLLEFGDNKLTVEEIRFQQEGEINWRIGENDAGVSEFFEQVGVQDVVGRFTVGNTEFTVIFGFVNRPRDGDGQPLDD